MTFADEPTRMIPCVRPPFISGGLLTVAAGARADVGTGAGAFAAMVGGDDPGILASVSGIAASPVAAVGERQNGAVAGDALPVLSPDAVSDPSWLATLLASTAVIGQPAANTDTAPAAAAAPKTVGPQTTISQPAVTASNAIALPEASAAIVPPAALLPDTDTAPPAIAASDSAVSTTPVPPFGAKRKPTGKSDVVIAADITVPADPAPATLAAINPTAIVVSPPPSTVPPATPDLHVAASPKTALQAAAAAVPGPGIAPLATNANGLPAPLPVPAPVSAAPAAITLSEPLSGSTPPIASVVQATAAPPPSRRVAVDTTAVELARPETSAPRIPTPGAPLVAAPSPVSLAVTPLLAAGAVAPAGEVFAAAIHAAGQRADRTDGNVPSLQGIAFPDAAPIAAAAAIGSSADPSLDMRHGNWPSAMIDHIEKLRDAADAVDTRIRLVPDALGGIDVSLRRRDDGVQVSLRADHAATQAMLADARPQLTAMAEARGIRLSDSSSTNTGTGTGGGTTGGGLAGDPSTANGRQQPRAFTPSAPASATATSDTLDPADGRVA